MVALCHIIFMHILSRNLRAIVCTTSQVAKSRALLSQYLKKFNHESLLIWSKYFWSWFIFHFLHEAFRFGWLSSLKFYDGDLFMRWWWWMELESMWSITLSKIHMINILLRLNIVHIPILMELNNIINLALLLSLVGGRATVTMVIWTCLSMLIWIWHVRSATAPNYKLAR